MAKTWKIIQSGFGGGISNNSKSGPENSCRFSRNLNIYSDQDSVQLNPAPVKDSGTAVTDLVKWMTDVLPFATDKYAYGDSGNIYKITSGNAWSLDRSGGTIGNGAAGQGLCSLSDYLYYATSTTLGRKGLLDGTPVYNDNFVPVTLDQQNQNSTGSPNTYTLPNAISEAATATCSFIPTFDPIQKISVLLKATGTGNWTLTLHDSQNTVLGTATVANGSLVATANFQPFVFASPVRVNIGQTYHFHLTSSDGTGTVTTLVASDFSTVQYGEYFSVLIPDTNYHPLIPFTNGVTGTVLVGNGNYIGQWDGNTYNPNQITLEPGYSVRYFTLENEFVVAWCWRGTDTTKTELGRAYYWDGISKYYNYYYDITTGVPNASINSKNRTFSILGTDGNLTMDTEPFKKIQPAPQLPLSASVEVMPGAITNWRGRTLFGFGNCTDSTSFECGVYEYGSQSDKKISYTDVSTEVLNYSYMISTGTTKSTTLKIGCVKGFGSDLYIAWEDGANYGVDRVNKTNNAATTGGWESLIHDEGVDGATGQMRSMPEKQKIGHKVVITFAPLPSGATVTAKYRFDRASSWTLGTAVSTANATKAVCNVNGIGAGRYKEVEYGFDVTASTTSPVITSAYFEMSPVPQETDEQ